MDLAPYINPAVGINTRQDLIDIVNLHHGSALLGWEFRLLDWNLKPIQLPAPINPAVPNDMRDVVRTCTIDAQSGSGQSGRDVTRQMQLEIAEVPGLQFNPLLHRLRVQNVWFDLDRTRLFTVPVGTFRHTIPKRSLSDALNTWSGSWEDLSGRIADRKFVHDFASPAPIVATELIQGLLRADSRPPEKGGRTSGGGSWPFVNDPALSPSNCFYCGPNWPQTLIDIEYCPIILPTSLTWQGMTDKVFAAIQQVAQLINFLPLWTDPRGVLMGRPNPYQYIGPDGTTITPQADFFFEYGQDSIFNGAVSVGFPDLTQIGNYAAVQVDNNSRPMLFAEGWNDSYDSLISTVNYPDTIPILVKDDHIPDQDTANKRVRVELAAGAMAEQEIEFDCHMMPFLDINDFFGANVLSRNGVPEITVARYPYQVMKITYNIDKRTMHVVGRRSASI